MALPVVFVWRQRDCEWRWRYMEDDLVLTSNETYETEAHAEGAASVAYPGVRVVVDEEVPPPTDEPRGRRARRPSGRILMAAVLGIVLGAAFAVAVEALERKVVRRRRR